jgi:hypothetical protein
MVSTGSQYGNYNPAATDPYQIESVLAPLAVPDSAQAQMMLERYQMKNQANANVYGEELDKQHDFNRQQLHQQLVEAQMKTGAELAKLPGGAGLVANAPGLQATYGGAGPDAVRQMVDAATRAQGATDFEHTAAGYKSYSDAGAQGSTALLQGLTNLPFQQGERPDVRIGAGHDAAHLGAAAIGANADKNYVNIPGPPGADGLPTTSRVRINPNDEQGAVEAIRARRALLTAAETPSTPGMTQPGGGSGATTGGTTAGQTSLQNAPAQQNKGKSQLLDWRTPEGTLAQAQGRQHVGRLDTEAKKDVAANTPAAGILPLTKENGKVVFVGKTGRTYPAPP